MKTVIVTGGSRGIGAAIVKDLALKKYNVVLNYNKSEKEAEKIKEELKENDINIEIFKADVSDKKQAKELIEFTLNKFKNINVLINNAGIDQIKPFMEITENDWNTMFKINLNSVFNCTQEALKNMIHNKKGCIINISSIWGITGASCEVHYSASKAAIDGMTKALAKELGPSNIRVNSIAPGLVNTEMNKELSKEDLAELKKEIPLGRIAQPEEIAKSVEWLIEDEYVSGQIISVNGGWNI